MLHMSGCVVTTAHTNDPIASQYETFAIAFLSSSVFGELSLESFLKLNVEVTCVL